MWTAVCLSVFHNFLLCQLTNPGIISEHCLVVISRGLIGEAGHDVSDFFELFFIASLFLTREEVKTSVILLNIDIWDLLYCLGSLLPRKHLADNALQRTIKRHVSTIAAHSITAGSLSSRSPSPHDTVGSTALNKRYDYWQADNIMQRGPFYTSYSEVLEIKILNAKPSIFVMAFSGFHA